jgi:uncharacterized protein YjdB
MLEDTISIRKNKNSTNIKKEQKLRQYGTHKTITGLRTDALEWYCIINKVLVLQASLVYRDLTVA